MALLNDSFDNLSLFYENNSTVIYKGVRRADGVQVILKSHKNPDEMFRIKHEFDLLSGRDIEGATNVLDISYNDDKNYLVLEDAGAIVLDDYLAANDLSLPQLLRVAQNAAAALATIHEAGIIHCDIKPANILVHPDTLKVWYIDFGISFSMHSREAKGEGFAGTLEFMAPEQTGRLDMVVDQRSDLYSLGITMYFMITGKLPFTGENAVELIHAQTVLHPAPLSEHVAVEPTVEALVLKLMEKSPRKRYQSAESLAFDLAACSELLELHGKIDPKEFTLGERDIFASLEPQQRLFGKQHLMDEMRGTYHNTPKDTASLILLHGPTGSGKSSLLYSFEQHVEDCGAYLLRGEFDWADNGEPYSAIRDLFEGFERFAYDANLPLPEYRTRILEALGENAQVLIDILPSFESILGQQPPVLKLSPSEAMQRAHKVFNQTMAILCNAPYPFVFVFENAQWADENSLNLLLSAIEAPGVGNCVMILSYRDDDPAFLADITPKVHGLDRRSLDVVDISVPHLGREEVTGLVLDFFDQDGMEARELAEVIYNATGGMLAQIRTYLQVLYRNGTIRHDAENDSWEINLDSLDDQVLESIEDKYIESFKNELTDLGRDMLCKFSCMGEVFDTSEGREIFGFSEEDVQRVLKTKVEKGFVTQDKRNPNLYAFAHKTVYDVCYEQSDEATRKGYHKQIADTLYEKYKGDEDALLARSTLFTRQILMAGRENYSEEMLQAISRIKLTAAEQVMASANMGQAARVFDNAIRLMGDKPFEFNYAYAYEVYLNYALCCFALHEYKKAAELFEVAVGHATSEADRYRAYYTIVKQYLAMADWENAKTYVKRYLADEGLLLAPDDDPVPAGDAEYATFRALTGEKGIMICSEFAQTEDELDEHHGNMLALLSAALMFSLDDDAKCKYYLYRTINFAVERERIFTEFTLCFCVGAARYASIRDFSWAKHLVETGLEYAEKNKTEQAFLWCVYGNMISHWVNPLAETLEIYKKAKYHAVMEGNAFYEAFADMMLLNYHSFIGENLEEYHRETQATLHNLQRARLDALQANFTTFRQYARCLLGRTEAPDSFDDAQFKEASLESIRGTWNGTFNDNFLFVYRLRSLYIHGFYDKAVEYAEKYAAFAKRYNMTAYITHIQFFYYYSMALIEVIRKNPETMDKHLPTIKRNQQNLGFYAKLNPLNFEYKFMLVETGVKGLTNDSIELVDAYATCQRGFMQKGLIWDAVFVERLIADFWAMRNIPQYVIIHKRNALGHYRAIGARYLVRQLRTVDEEYDKHIHASSTMGGGAGGATHMATAYMGTRHTGTATNTRSQYSGINVALDFQALLGVLEKLIDYDTLPSLATAFAGMLLQNGNAEKALLFLDEGGVPTLYAAKFAIEEDSDFNEAELPLEVGVIEDNVVPKRLVEMAKARNEVLCANAARNEYRAIGDEYLNAKAPESFLCLPINAKGKQLGVIYLENASLPGSFPDGRVRFLQALVHQTSALIVNLKNVAKLADYTKDLENRLSSYLSQQNALIAGIAHEINSPVGVCLTVSTKVHEKTAQVIEQFEAKQLGKGALTKYLEETRDGLNIINNNIMRAGNLIQNFKKMSVEQSTEVFENLELAPTVASIVEYVRPGVKKRIERIDIDIPEALWVHTSSGVLAQVFTNLIMNSSIHGFDGRDKENNFVSIKVTDLPAKEQIEIVYTDNGRGMNEEELEKVFQPFFTTRRNRGGSGLGGHIILTLITQTLGGSVRCESVPGEGTTYYIHLPKQAKQVTKEEAGK